MRNRARCLVFTPPQIPCFSSFTRANSRHSDLTEQILQRLIADLRLVLGTPPSGNQASGSEVWQAVAPVFRMPSANAVSACSEFMPKQ